MGGKPSRNISISSASSQEVKAKSSSQHPTPRTMTPLMEPLASEKVQKKDTGEKLQIAQVFEQHEQRMMILQKDKEIYEMQNKKMKQNILTLTSQLEEAKQQASRCNVGNVNIINR